jgi:hypothetical protein
MRKPLTLLCLLLAAPLLAKTVVKKPIPQTQYFKYEPGSSYAFAQKKRKFLKGQWESGPERLKLTVLDSVRDENIRIRILGEIEEKAGGPVKKQFFMAFLLTPSEALWERDVSVPLARLPLTVGDQIGNYRLESLQASLETSTGTFRHCLLIQGIGESILFAPYVGLIHWRILDEDWTLASYSLRDREGLETPSKKDWKQIENLARSFCSRYQLNFERLLSVDIKPGLSSAPCRFLISRPDPEMPEGRRFEVEERTFLR